MARRLRSATAGPATAAGGWAGSRTTRTRTTRRRRRRMGKTYRLSWTKLTFRQVAPTSLLVKERRAKGEDKNRNGSSVKFSSRPWLLVNVVQRMIYPRFNVSCLAEQSV